MARITLVLHHSTRLTSQMQWLLAHALSDAFRHQRPGVDVSIARAAKAGSGWQLEAPGVGSIFRQWLDGHKSKYLKIMLVERGKTRVVYLDHLPKHAKPHHPEWELQLPGKKRVSIPAFAVHAQAASTLHHSAYIAVAVGENKIAQLKEVLRGYTVFVKWQRSTMPLVLLGHSEKATQQATQLLKDYRYRAQVLLRTVETGIAPNLENAYALLLSHAAGQHTQQLLLAAMQQEVAIVSALGQSHEGREKTNMEQCIYPATQDAESIGKAMVELYRNEARRAAMVASAKHIFQASAPGLSAAAILHQLEQ